MQSKISIDLDYNNNPVIKVKLHTTEDVRDKLINQFFNFSPFFKLTDKEGGSSDGGSLIEMTYVPGPNTKQLIDEIEKWRKENYPEVEKNSEYDFSTINTDDSSFPIIGKRERIIGVPQSLLEEKIGFIRLFKGEYFSLQTLIDYNPYMTGDSKKAITNT